MSVPFVYRDSPLTLPDDPADGGWDKREKAPRPGEKLADGLLTVWLHDRQEEVRLRRLTGSSFLLLILAENEAQAVEYARKGPIRAGKVPFQTVPVLAGFPALPAGTALLLRPDGHLSARRLTPPSNAELDRMLSLMLHPPE